MAETAKKIEPDRKVVQFPVRNMKNQGNGQDTLLMDRIREMIRNPGNDPKKTGKEIAELLRRGEPGSKESMLFLCGETKKFDPYGKWLAVITALRNLVDVLPISALIKYANEHRPAAERLATVPQDQIPNWDRINAAKALENFGIRVE
ncbi:hypothetical protein KJ780_04600 [Candidatus Micrarchaeota archaeon]|nr:hypothetical protein [Candidatus Micrarchaeota archaeon]